MGRAKAQWPWNPRPPPQSYADQSRQLGIFTAVSVLSFFLSLNMQFLSQLKNCFQKGHVKRAKLLSGRLNHLDHQHWEMFPALENEHWKGWDFALPWRALDRSGVVLRPATLGRERQGQGSPFAKVQSGHHGYVGWLCGGEGGCPLCGFEPGPVPAMPGLCRPRDLPCIEAHNTGSPGPRPLGEAWFLECSPCPPHSVLGGRWKGALLPTPPIP